MILLVASRPCTWRTFPPRRFFRRTPTPERKLGGSRRVVCLMPPAKSIVVTACAGTLVAGAALGWAGSGSATYETATRRTPGPPLKQFVIGVYTQPTYTFETWRRRGINTLVRSELLSGTVSWEDWHAAAARNGFPAIRAPHGDPPRAAAAPRLLAWLLPDEPDLGSHPVSPGRLAATAAGWRRAAPHVPIV